jgi:hypothetical protein
MMLMALAVRRELGGGVRQHPGSATALRVVSGVLYPLSGAAAARERHGTASSFRLGLFNATLR